MLKIDLGCGPSKQSGFVGVDRFSLPGVDVVADLDKRLPFDDDSVELVCASHSLEHVGDLMNTMREIYRVCRHGAQVCIVAPYNEQKLNLANPYHRWVFNEHTPRFWSDYAKTPLDADEYRHPHAADWGLSRSDHANPGLELRLINMEFFYFPEYEDLPTEEQRKLRRQRMDVCDQVIYHLIVWKETADTGVPFEEFVATVERYEPRYVKQRKAHSQEQTVRRLTQQRDEARAAIAALRADLSKSDQAIAEHSRSGARIAELNALIERTDALLGDARAENHALRMREVERFQRTDELGAQLLSSRNDSLRHQEEARVLSHTAERFRSEAQDANTALLQAQTEMTSLAESVEHHRNKVQGLTEHVSVLTDRLHAAQETIQVSEASADQTRTLLATLTQRNQYLTDLAENAKKVQADLVFVRAELEASNGLAAWHRHREELLTGENARLSAEVARVAAEITSIASTDLLEARKTAEEFGRQLSSRRASRSARLSYFLSSGNMSWRHIGPAFADLKAYSEKFFRRSSKTQFSLGGDLRGVPYIEYTMPFKAPSLRSVSLAVHPLLRSDSGTIGIEIVSAEKEIVTRSTVPLVGIDRYSPTEFVLPAELNGLGAGWGLRVFVAGVDVPVSVYELVDYSLFRRRIKFAPFALLS